MANYGLRCFSSVKQGLGYIGDVTGDAQGWTRSTRWMGGFWQGRFTLNLGRADLQQWFYEFLGYHLEEKSGGGVSWEGMIYEMDLISNGVRRRRSLDLMSNAIKVRYISDIGVVSETAWAVQQQSLNRYGRKEDLLSMDGYSATPMAARRDTLLTERGWPWPRHVSMQKGGSAALEVTVCGYVFAANWKFVTAQAGTTGNVSDWVSSILTTDCNEFLSVGRVQANTLQVKQTLSMPQRAFDTIAELSSLGDATYVPWRCWVDVGRKVYYAPLNPAVRYYWMNDGLQNSASDQIRVAPWLVRPAVVRDQTYPMRRTEPGSMLADVRDGLIEEAEVDQDGNLMLRSLLIEEADILAQQQDFLQAQKPKK